ncbi:hypothetical protein [Glycomyces lechevalierae]|uniref:Uncharacterized protein n=1 Tax=Glycomyces lechevalierae TaxID=256034 RepID=A0ABU2AJM5_9ACTN|nr:hypothetical protein [Glycomyces lechevalierae]MDR7336823.1 hypothetical protein [Glycomyces lechevalierae]
MPSLPTKRVIRDHLARTSVKPRHRHAWADFLHGLDWPVIKPLTQIAVNTNVHPAIAAAKIIQFTQDEHTRALLQEHLEAKAGHTEGAHTSTPEG